MARAVTGTSRSLADPRRPGRVNQRLRSAAGRLAGANVELISSAYDPKQF
jgi:hypothetical protein